MQSWSNQQSAGYELIDFGRSRKLESFGGIVVNRPCPAAAGASPQTNAWESAELIYEPSKQLEGRWVRMDNLAAGPEPWMVEFVSHGLTQPLRLIVRTQATGQLGLFPEHWQQWPWFQRQIERWHAAQSHHFDDFRVPRILHLFAYTGATTLALATMQTEVTHVDAMQSAVDWARDNSRASHLATFPIRWIVDDARKYVARERRRRKKYDLVLLDPPTYGHGAAGQTWSIQRDLEPLLLDCAELVSADGIGLVLTGHSPDVDLQRLHEALANSREGHRWTRMEKGQAGLQDRAGRTLDCGYVARFLTDCYSGAFDEG